MVDLGGTEEPTRTRHGGWGIRDPMMIDRALGPYPIVGGSRLGALRRQRDPRAGSISWPRRGAKGGIVVDDSGSATSAGYCFSRAA